MRCVSQEGYGGKEHSRDGCAEVLRHLQTTTHLSTILRPTGLNRQTLMRYRVWATEQGLLAGPLPPVEELRPLVARTLTPPAPPQTISTVTPYRDLVLALARRGWYPRGHSRGALCHT